MPLSSLYRNVRLRLRHELAMHRVFSEWKAMRSAAGAAAAAREPGRLVVIPCDFDTVVGSRGDQAMITAAIGRPSLTLALNFAKLAATAASLLLTRGRPLETVVWAFVAGQLCVTPLNYAFARRGFGLSLLECLRRFAPFLLGCAAMVLVALLLRAVPSIQALPALSRLAALAGTALGTYALVCLAAARREIMRVVRERKR